MAAIFISYARADVERAQALLRRFEDAGHSSLFLDLDPVHGIGAGSQWERELHDKLRSCVVLVALVGMAWKASPWCLAEWLLARGLGKIVVPVRIDGSDLPAWVVDRQAVDWSDPEDEEAFRRILRAIDAASVNALAPEAPDAIPFPGLRPFCEGEAAYFFGRDEEILDLAASLRARRSVGGDRVLVLVGPSGCGKSSFVLAGLVPYLKRDPEPWRIVGPYVPERDLSEHAAKIAEQLADSPHGTPLLVLDQLEQLFANEGISTAARTDFLRAIGAALERTRGFCVATLRSDYFEELQEEEGARALGWTSRPVSLLSGADLERVVSGPAQRAGLEVDEGLAGRVVQEAGTENSLPLVAFALHELWSAGRASGRLRLGDYERLDGVNGAIRTVAEAVVPSTLDEDVEKVLRSALLALVRIDERDRVVKRIARLSELPDAAHPWIERLVAARLLTRGERDEIQVAHERLFTAWARYAGWIEDKRDVLAWRRDVANARQAFDQHPEGVLPDSAVERALPFLREGNSVSDEDKPFLDRSIRAYYHRRRLRTWRQAGALVLAALAILTAGVIYKLFIDADTAARQFQARLLLDKAREVYEEEPSVALELLLEASDICPSSDAGTTKKILECVDAYAQDGVTGSIAGQYSLLQPLPFWKHFVVWKEGRVNLQAEVRSAVHGRISETVTVGDPRDKIVKTLSQEGEPAFRIGSSVYRARDGEVLHRTWRDRGYLDTGTFTIRRGLGFSTELLDSESRVLCTLNSIEHEEHTFIPKSVLQAVQTDKHRWVLVSCERTYEFDEAPHGDKILRQIYRVSDGFAPVHGPVATIKLIGSVLCLVSAWEKSALNATTGERIDFEGEVIEIVEVDGTGYAFVKRDDTTYARVPLDGAEPQVFHSRVLHISPAGHSFISDRELRRTLDGELIARVGSEATFFTEELVAAVTPFAPERPPAWYVWNARNGRRIGPIGFGEEFRMLAFPMVESSLIVAKFVSRHSVLSASSGEKVAEGYMAVRGMCDELLAVWSGGEAIFFDAAGSERGRLASPYAQEIVFHRLDAPILISESSDGGRAESVAVHPNATSAENPVRLPGEFAGNVAVDPAATIAWVLDDDGDILAIDLRWLKSTQGPTEPTPDEILREARAALERSPFRNRARVKELME